MVTKYSPIWHKYRPAILKLMVDSAQKTQEYPFSAFEFKDIDAKQKGGFAFTLRVYDCKAINDIKTSVVAQDLLAILKQSEKANQLTREAIYEFTMDKQFVFHVSREEAPIEEKEEGLEEADQEENEKTEE
ncbi:MAG: hypothetical protein AAF363_21215 [Bacteroidota bacterium]